MNIPEHIMQQVADEAFESSDGGTMGLLTCIKTNNNLVWHDERHARRAVIQHALDNPALAPFLAGEAIARAEKAEAELSAIKSSQLGILRPIVEMPETVPEGCIKFTGFKDEEGDLIFGNFDSKVDTHFTLLRMTDAEATPPAEVVPVRSDNEQTRLEDIEADAQLAEELAQSEPAAQVPLGPEDMKPNAWFKLLDGSINPLEFATPFGVVIKGQREMFTFGYLKDSGVKMNESIPDTGRWDANAWRPCSKPGKEVAK